ncbi:MAG: RDD family protein [Candidatus Nanopelagicus sp.]
MNWQGEPQLLPEATLLRRVIALIIDWTMSRLIASLIGPYLFFESDFNTLIVFYLEVTLLTTLLQASAGQRIMGVKVLSYPDQSRISPKQVALRTLLICLVLPAVFTKDGRALHDYFTNSQTVRELY